MEFRISEQRLTYLFNLDPCNEKPLKEWFPEIFDNSLKVNKWYKNKHLPNTVINCQYFSPFEKWGYGIHDGIWSQQWGLLNYEDYVPATDEEVKEVLIAEAKRRGFKEGVRFKEFDNRAPTGTKVFKEFDFWNLHDGCHNEQRFNIGASKELGSGVIYRCGQWAEIISEPIELTLEDIAEKFGESVEEIKIKK